MNIFVKIGRSFLSITTAVMLLLSLLPMTALAITTGNGVGSVSEVVRPILGDVDDDGEVTVADALIALQIATGKVKATSAQATAADVDGMVGVSANDALMILQYTTMKIGRFPADTDDDNTGDDENPGGDEGLGSGDGAEDIFPN